jgi:hypothetical protein
LGTGIAGPVRYVCATAQEGAMLLNDPLFITAAIAALVVLAILMFGIGTFASGKDPSGHKANKIMWWRIGAQFVAVVLIVGFAYFRSRG